MSLTARRFSLGLIAVMSNNHSTTGSKASLRLWVFPLNTIDQSKCFPTSLKINEPMKMFPVDTYHSIIMLPLPLKTIDDIVFSSLFHSSFATSILTDR